MSEKTIKARLEDDLETTMREFIAADAHHTQKQRDYHEARLLRDELREEAARLHRAALILAGASPDATSLTDPQVNTALNHIEERLKKAVKS